MVRRLFSAIHSEISGVHQAALLLAVSGIAAKALALLRDRLLAGKFGAGAELDVYFAAFRIPDFIFALSVVFTTSAVVIPKLLEWESKNAESGRRFVRELAGTFAASILVVAGAALFLMPVLAPWVAPGFSSDALPAFIRLARILLLSPILLGFSMLLSNVIQAHRRFFIYALSPILYNVGVIAGILWFLPRWGMDGLAWGVASGALLHLAVQIPSAVRLGYAPRFSFRWSPAVADVVRLSIPRSMGLGLNQAVVVAFTAMASLGGAGSISIFQLAYNLFGIPLGVIGLSYSVAAFPSLVRSAAGRAEEFAASVTDIARHILLWSLPCAVLAIVLRAHIVRIVLGTGEFGWRDTRLTAAALALFSVSIVAQGFVLLYTRAFYAGGKTRFPLFVNIASAALSIVAAVGGLWALGANPDLASALDAVLRISDIPQTAVVVLPLAFTVGSLANAALLVIGFSAAFGGRRGEWRRAFREHGMAALVLGASSYGVLRVTDGWFDLQTFSGIFAHGALAAGIGIGAVIAVLAAFRNRELAEVGKALHHRFWREAAIAPEPRSAMEG